MGCVPCSQKSYEPFNKAMDRDLILKTLFLLALASANRGGGLQDLSAEVHLFLCSRLRGKIPESFSAKREIRWILSAISPGLRWR